MSNYYNFAINNIEKLDYQNLVNLLMQNITPETRARVLHSLTGINNQLLDQTRKSHTETAEIIDLDDLVDNMPTLDEKLDRLTFLYRKLKLEKQQRKQRNNYSFAK